MTMQQTSKKRWLTGAVALLVLALVGAGVAKILLARKNDAAALQAASSAQNTNAVELALGDVMTLKNIELLQGLPVSGSLRAVNSAFVKARVAGELQGLSVREGDFVQAGQVLARVDASENQSRARQARNQADASKAQVEVAQRQYDNNTSLVNQGFISKTALDTSLANLNAAKSTYQAALAATDVATKAVDDTVLRAPISGQISQRLAQLGERVGVDTRILEIVDLSRLELEATLSAADSSLVRVGQTAELQIEGGSQRITARVVRINPSAQAGSRSVLAYLSLDNMGSPNKPQSASLRQGLFAQGMLASERRSQLAVPLTAVRTDKPAPYLQIVSSGRIAHLPVELGMRGTAENLDVVAIKGAPEGTVVVLGNIGLLRESTAVKYTLPAGKTAALPAASAPVAASASASAPQ